MPESEQMPRGLFSNRGIGGTSLEGDAMTQQAMRLLDDPEVAARMLRARQNEARFLESRGSRPDLLASVRGLCEGGEVGSGRKDVRGMVRGVFSFAKVAGAQRGIKTLPETPYRGVGVRRNKRGQEGGEN
ncbi:MAG: hypothetical protein WC651_05135 [Candidatus Gracilibacteria bacterium]